MDDIQGFLPKIWGEIKGPRGGLYVALGGVLLSVFGCISVVLSGTLAQASQKGSFGYSLSGFISFVALSVLCVGAVAVVSGGIASIARYLMTANLFAKAEAVPIPALVETPSQPVKIATVTPTPKPAPLPVQQAASLPPRVVSQPVVQVLTIDQRRQILQQEINKYIRRGYRVVSQTDTTAQLVKPKSFSCFWFLVNTILLIGWIFYLIWYLAKRDSQVYLEVDLKGKVHARR